MLRLNSESSATHFLGSGKPVSKNRLSADNLANTIALLQQRLWPPTEVAVTKKPGAVQLAPGICGVGISRHTREGARVARVARVY